MFKINQCDFTKIILGAIGLIIWLFGFLFGYSNNNISAIYFLFLSIYLLIISRNNYLQVIVLAILSFCNYSIVYAEYIFPLSDSFFTSYAGTEISYEGSYVMLLFWSVLAIFMPVPDSDTDIYEIKLTGDAGQGNEIYLVTGIDILLLFILIYSFSRPDVIGTSRGGGSALYEYSIIFFILCFYYGRRIKVCVWVNTILLLVFAAQEFIYGGRITGVQLIFVLYIMILSEKITLKKTVPFIAVGFVGMSILGYVRQNWINGFSLSSVISSLWSNGFVLDTAYSAYHTSMTFLLAEPIAGEAGRLKIFWGYLKSLLLGGGNTVDNNVAQYTRQYFTHYYGGVLPFFGHFFLGWLGVALIALLVAWLFKLCNKIGSCQGSLKCVVIYFVSTSFRWYLYSPTSLIRGALLMLFAYFVAELILWLLRGGRPTEDSA